MGSFFGKLINDIREERMITIDELASLSGVPSSQLIDIEAGQTKVPIFAFFKILRALSLSSNYKSSEACVSHNKDVCKYDSTEENIKYCPLTLGPGVRHMTPFILQIFDKEWSDMNADRGGEDFIYVLSGAVEILHGDKKYHLLPGDSIYFDSAVAHSVKNLDNNYSKLLIVLY